MTATTSLVWFRQYENAGFVDPCAAFRSEVRVSLHVNRAEAIKKLRKSIVGRPYEFWVSPQGEESIDLEWTRQHLSPGLKALDDLDDEQFLRALYFDGLSITITDHEEPA